MVEDVDAASRCPRRDTSDWRSGWHLACGNQLTVTHPAQRGRPRRLRPPAAKLLRDVALLVRCFGVDRVASVGGGRPGRLGAFCRVGRASRCLPLWTRPSLLATLMACQVVGRSLRLGKLLSGTVSRSAVHRATGAGSACPPVVSPNGGEPVTFPVEVDRTVSGSGNPTVGGQRFWLGPDGAGPADHAVSTPPWCICGSTACGSRPFRPGSTRSCCPQLLTDGGRQPAAPAGQRRRAGRGDRGRPAGQRHRPVWAGRPPPPGWEPLRRPPGHRPPGPRPAPARRPGVLLRSDPGGG